MVIRTNVASLCAYREYKKTARATAKNLEKLSSGYRINRSADDASGLSASERMRANITELDRCENNALEGLKLAKTADGALAEINDMLRRARELCIQAENGTYSEQELASISDEMNQLFSEIDRITEGSFFNEIQLFRGDVGPDFHYEYDETFNIPPDGNLAEWGEMGFVKTATFDYAEKAKAATTTFQLDKGIKFDDVSTLNGRTITVGRYTYYFTDGTVNIPNNYYNTPINLNSYPSVDSALTRFKNLVLADSADHVSSMVIDKNTRTVTMTAPLHNLNGGTFEADGMTLPNNAPLGNGAWANGTTAASSLPGSVSLEQVDGQGAANNAPFYSDTATCSINLSSLSNTLTDIDVTNLNGNTLNIAGRSFSLKDLNPTAGMSRDAFGAKLADKIKSLGSNYDAAYDSSTQRVKVTLKDLPTTTGSAGLIFEGTTSAQTHPETKQMFISSALNCSFNITTPASGERPEVCEVTVPSTSSAPFSFMLNGTKYLYYDSSVNSLLENGYEYTEYNGSRYPVPTIINTLGKDRTWIMNDIASKIRWTSGVGNVQVNGDKITVTANSLSTSMNLSSKIKGTTIAVTSYRDVEDSPGTDRVFGNSSPSFQKTATIPFSLGKDLDVDKLAGSGFSITYGGVSNKFEFSKGTGIHPEYTDIDISGCTTFEEVKNVVAARMGSTYTVEIDQSNPDDVNLLINRSVANNISVIDGAAGIKSLIADGGAAQYTDGINTGYSQKSIDFSSVNSDNLNDLLGKGFRINCATCEGEYINVFFCWENNDRAPENFEIEYNGEKRTIHNIAVELSKVTSGDQIVQSIVDQVRPTLKHFTDVAVGNPPTTLVAKDKRIGDVIVGSDIKLGQVQSGLNANFTYSVNIRKVEDYPADGSVVQKNNNVEIYVGSEPNPQIIPIHLPYIDLKTLRLRPPETVDLNADDQDASDWLNRVDRANLFISESRGVIGADHNRLEHAVKQLSSAHVDLADAESRIRDTDMAEEMMEHVKLQILTQAQQGMLAQANSRPQQILQLIS